MGEHRSVSAAQRPALMLMEQPSLEAAGLPASGQGQADTAEIETQDFVPPKGAIFVPAEIALLIAVTLPKMAAAQRKQAVQFAVEDKIAQPLDQVHVVLGPKIQDDGTSASWLVAVVSNAAMEDVIATFPASSETLLLDVLALQVPAEGEWSVLVVKDRALVRLPDQSGFATTPSMLPIFWTAAGKPKIQLLGGVLPDEMPFLSRANLQEITDPAILRFDLRSARFGRSGAGWPKGIRAVAAVLAAAAIGHLSLIMLDIIGLQRMAAAQESALFATLEATGQPVLGDIESTLVKVLAAQTAPVRSDFLPILAESFGAIGPQSGQLQIRDLRFAKAQNALTLTVEAPDLAALQTAETAFAAAGLQVSAGAATTADGAAEAQMTLRRTTP